MWAILVAAGSVILAFVFSLGKASSRAERIADQHRKELFERKKKDETPS